MSVLPVNQAMQYRAIQHSTEPVGPDNLADENRSSIFSLREKGPQRFPAYVYTCCLCGFESASLSREVPIGTYTTNPCPQLLFHPPLPLPSVCVLSSIWRYGGVVKYTGLSFSV